MEPHGSNCGWFWAWTIAGFGLALGFVAIFSLGPILLPFVTLLVGVAACRRADPRSIAAAVVVVLAGFVAAFTVSLDALVIVPLVTLALGLWPALPRTAPGLARIVLIAAVIVACGVAVVSASPAPDTALAVYPIALVAFALAAVGRLDAEASGLIAGAALAGAMLGGPTTLLLAAVAGVAAFPLLRRPAGTPLRG
jgi:hypothetical protein